MPSPADKLSPDAKRVWAFLQNRAAVSGSRSFSVNDLRSFGLGGWRAIAAIFGELEARGFGQILDDVPISFQMNERFTQ